MIRKPNSFPENELLKETVKDVKMLKDKFDNNLHTRIDAYLGHRNKTIDRGLTIVGILAAIFGITLPIILSIDGMMLYSQIKETEKEFKEISYKIKDELKAIQKERNCLESYKQDVAKTLNKIRDLKNNIAKSKREVENYAKDTNVKYHNIAKQVLKINTLVLSTQKSATQSEFNRLITDGENFLKANRPHDAIRAYRKALNISDKHPMLYNNLGIVYQSLNQKHKAIDCYKKAIAIDGNRAMFYSNMAGTKMLIGLYDEALSDYDKAIALSINNDFIKENSSNKTEQEIPRINFVNSEMSINHYYGNKGIVCLKQKKYKEAMYNFGKAIKISPSDSEYYWGLGVAQAGLNLSIDAIKSYKKSIFLNPKELNVYICYSNELLKKGKYQDAFNILSKAIILNPSSENAFYQRAYAQIRLKQFNGAYEDIAQSLRIKPTSRAYLIKTVLDNHSNKFDDAFSSISCAITLSPQNANLYYNRALTCLLINPPKVEQALSDINRIKILKKDKLLKSYTPVLEYLINQISKKNTVDFHTVFKKIQAIDNQNVNMNGILNIAEKYSDKSIFARIHRWFLPIEKMEP